MLAHLLNDHSKTEIVQSCDLEREEIIAESVCKLGAKVELVSIL